MNSREGQTLGNYELLHLIGQGSFAEVYVGKQRYIETIVAIKVLQRIGPETNESFRREARTIAHLQHPHIMHIYDFGIEDQTPYLAMEYTPIGSLRSVHPSGSRLSCEQIVIYVKQIASALDYAHQQRVIHRDIKPENILLNARREVLLSDFGIAVVLPTMDTFATQNQAGTPLYMAPEQIRSHPVPASDQYALAVMIYEWLCGELPFRGSLFELFTQHLYQPPPGLVDRVPGLPPAVENVVFRALAKNPQQRFPTMQDFAHALEAACVATQPLQQASEGFHVGAIDVARTNLFQQENYFPTLSASPNPPSHITSSFPTYSQKGIEVEDESKLQSIPAHESIPALLGQTTQTRPPGSLPQNAAWSRFDRKKLIFLSAAVLIVVSSLVSFFLLNSSSDPQKTYDGLVQQSADLTFHSADWPVSSPKNPPRCTFNNVNAVYTAAIVPTQSADFANYYSTYCWNQTAQYSNFLYQVDVRIDRGSCAGLLFRLTSGTLQVGGQPSGYYFGICPDWSQRQGGTCRFFVYVNGQISESDQNCKDIVNNRSGTDTIAVLAQNDTLNFFINKKFVFSRRDTKYQSGYIAVVVANSRPPSGQPGNPTEQAKFSNINVWAIANK